MRGTDQQQSHVFSYISPEQRVHKDHPLRPIRAVVDEILKPLSPQFSRCAREWAARRFHRSSYCAHLLQMLYSVRSERLLMEEMDYNILFRWFVGLNLDDEVWDATVFTKNRDRLLEAEVAKEFLARVVAQATGEGMDFGRALHGGRHAAGVLNEREEFSAPGEEGWASAGGSGIIPREKRGFSTM